MISVHKTVAWKIVWVVSLKYQDTDFHIETESTHSHRMDHQDIYYDALRISILTKTVAEVPKLMTDLSSNEFFRYC